MRKYSTKDIDQLLTKKDKIKLVGKKAFRISKSGLKSIKDKFKSDLVDLNAKTIVMASQTKENVINSYKSAKESVNDFYDDTKEMMEVACDDFKDFKETRKIENELKKEKREESRKELFSDVTEFLNDKTNELTEQQEIFKNIVAEINKNNNSTMEDDLISDLFGNKIKSLDRKKVVVTGKTYALYALSKVALKRIVAKCKKETPSINEEKSEVKDSLLQENSDVLNVFAKEGKPYSIDDFLPQSSNNVDIASLAAIAEKVNDDVPSNEEIVNTDVEKEINSSVTLPYTIDDFLPNEPLKTEEEKDLIYIADNNSNSEMIAIDDSIKIVDNDSIEIMSPDVAELQELINQRDSLDRAIEKIIGEAKLSGGNKRVVHNCEEIMMTPDQAAIFLKFKNHKVLLNEYIKTIAKKIDKAEKKEQKIKPVKVTNISKSKNIKTLINVALVGAIAFTFLANRTIDKTSDLDMSKVDLPIISYEDQILKPEINSVIPVVPTDKVEIELDLDSNENTFIKDDININDEITFNEGTKIYLNSDDGTAQSNQLTPIHDYDDTRVVSGITFNLNDELITVFENEDNASDKIDYLLEQGAKKVLYVTNLKENVNNVGNQYEGFVNIEDVVLQNEELVGGNSR